MSRSRRKPWYVMTHKIDKDIVHGRIRAKMRGEMAKAEPNVAVLEGDAKEFGFADWGTKFGFDFMGSLSELERERYGGEREKACRK